MVSYCGLLSHMIFLLATTGTAKVDRGSAITLIGLIMGVCVGELDETR
jgi:hypothetical protein